MSRNSGNQTDAGGFASKVFKLIYDADIYTTPLHV
jgi:hypothetical protein